MSEGINIQNDEEIQKALEEFELKDGADEARKIAQDTKPEKSSRMADLVIRYSHGYIKDKRQAEYVLLVFVFLTGVLSAFLFFSGGNKNVPPQNDLINESLNKTIQNSDDFK